jgi:HK97 family phage portal protein
VPNWLRFGPPLLARAAAPAPAQKAALDLLPVYPDGLAPYGGSAAAVPAAGAVAYGDGNSAVFACLAALGTSYCEPPLKVWQIDADEERAWLPDHPCQLLLDNPNPFITALELWGWATWAYHLDGNAFVRKERTSKRGAVVRLWPMSPTRVQIFSTGNDFISYYRWFYASGQFEDLDPRDVIHFRLGLDDRDPRRGLSPLARLVRAVTTDERAARWTDTLLGNYALPGMMITTKNALTEQQARQLAETAQWLYSEERRGRVGVIGGDATMAQVGFSPEQMLLRDIHSVPEERISAVLRVPAIIAGLGAGLDAATYANARQAREYFTEATLVGLWAQDDAKLQAQLLPDFTDDPTIRIARDLSDLRAFAEDETQKYARLKEAVGGPFLTVNEARADLGRPALSDGDVLFVPVAVVALPSDQLQPPPAPEPVPAEEPAAPAATPEPGASDTIPELEPSALQAASGWEVLVKAEPPPVRITAADIARAQEWVAGLGLPDLEAALAGSGKARRNGHANGRHRE